MGVLGWIEMKSPARTFQGVHRRVPMRVERRNVWQVLGTGCHELGTCIRWKLEADNIRTVAPWIAFQYRSFGPAQARRWNSLQVGRSATLFTSPHAIGAGSQREGCLVRRCTST